MELCSKKDQQGRGDGLIKSNNRSGLAYIFHGAKDGGPVKTSFTFIPSEEYTITGAVSEPNPVTNYETAFGMDVSYFENSVVFRQKIRLKTTSTIVKGSLRYMVCNDQKCLLPEIVSFAIPIKCKHSTNPFLRRKTLNTFDTSPIINYGTVSKQKQIRQDNADK